MIYITKRKVDERKIDNIYFEHSNIFDKKYKKESFNTILHLLDDNQNVMQRIKELLKLEGLFISETACLGEKLLLGFFFIFLSKIGIVPFIKPFKISELEDSIAENFQIINTKKTSHNPPNYFVVARKV